MSDLSDAFLVRTRESLLGAESEFVAAEDGVERGRGAGGLVTVLCPVERYAAPTWISAARSDTDRLIDISAPEYARSPRRSRLPSSG